MSTGVRGPAPTDSLRGATELSALPEVERLEAPEVDAMAEMAATSKLLGLAGADAAESASPLQLLRTGALDFSSYLELQVQTATQHLEGALDVEALEQVRDELRIALQEDPDVAALAQLARIGS